MKGSAEREDARGVSIYPVLLVNFIGTLGYSIILPFLIFLVTRLGGGALVYGLLGAIYPAFQLIGAPILGRWSDVYGRREDSAAEPGRYRDLLVRVQRCAVPSGNCVARAR